MQSLYLVVVLSIGWLALCLGMWRLHRSRTQYKIEGNEKTLIVYASQTGNAQSIAQRCADALNGSGKSSLAANVPPINVIALNALTPEHLQSLEKVLFIVSTYGDGDAPDNGNLLHKLFVPKLKKRKNQSKSGANTNIDTHKFTQLSYSVVALGDSSYPDFCAFGYQVDQEMKAAGANQLSEIITVDNYDEQTTNLADITPGWLNISKKPSANTLSTLAVKSPQYWQLIERELLNPNCHDEKLLQLTFKSIGPSPFWQAGDLLDIQPKHPSEVVDNWLSKNSLRGDTWLTLQGRQQQLKYWLRDRELPSENDLSEQELVKTLPYLHKRSYSIASISEEGYLQLIVRLFEKPNFNNAANKTFGLASGYLSQYCQVGDVVDGHIRDVGSHHNIDHRKPIILIGAGSGLAGLKAQISARFYLASTQAKVVGKSWLIFGERNSNPELPINKQLSEFEKTPEKIHKLSCAFSQNSAYPKYVQNILLNEQDTFKKWLDDGAYIYVCGSLTGMGEGVQQTLLDILGEDGIEMLQEQQRYIRDVY